MFTHWLVGSAWQAHWPVEQTHRLSQTPWSPAPHWMAYLVGDGVGVDVDVVVLLCSVVPATVMVFSCAATLVVVVVIASNRRRSVVGGEKGEKGGSGDCVGRLVSWAVCERRMGVDRGVGRELG